MAMKSLHDLFVHELRDLYHAEKQLLRALPKMAKAATSEHLKAGFEEHLEQTEEQVHRLEEAFEALGVAARGVRCVAMEGLIEEGSKIMEEKAEPAVRDAGLIAAAQKIEHYEIAGYGTVTTYAALLGEDRLRDILHAILEEEKETDRKLTELAEAEVNAEANV